MSARDDDHLPAVRHQHNYGSGTFIGGDVHGDINIVNGPSSAVSSAPQEAEEAPSNSKPKNEGRSDALWTAGGTAFVLAGVAELLLYRIAWLLAIGTPLTDTYTLPLSARIAIVPVVGVLGLLAAGASLCYVVACIRYAFIDSEEQPNKAAWRLFKALCKKTGSLVVALFAKIPALLRAGARGVRRSLKGARQTFLDVYREELNK